MLRAPRFCIVFSLVWKFDDQKNSLNDGHRPKADMAQLQLCIAITNPYHSSMPRPPAPFRLSFRTLWVGLLALALMVQPLVAAIGEVHELSHAAGSLSAVASHADDHSSAQHADQAPNEPESNDAMHVLLHFAHCCSQTPTTLGAAQVQFLAIVGSDAPLVAAAPLPLQASTNDVLRPPIAA